MAAHSAAGAKIAVRVAANAAAVVAANSAAVVAANSAAMVQVAAAAAAAHQPHTAEAAAPPHFHLPGCLRCLVLRLALLLQLLLLP